MFSKRFWIRTVERVVRAGAIGAGTVAGLNGFNVLTADWQAVGAAAGTAAFLSLLLCLTAGASPVGEPGAPAFVKDDPPPAV